MRVKLFIVAVLVIGIVVVKVFVLVVVGFLVERVGDLVVEDERQGLRVLDVEDVFVPLKAFRDGVESVVNSGIGGAAARLNRLEVRLKGRRQMPQCFARVCTHGYDVTWAVNEMGGLMNENSPLEVGHRIEPRLYVRRTDTRVEWRVVDLPRDLPRSAATMLLAEHAEYGSWELARSVTYMGGKRRVWLKRKRMRVVRTDAA